VVLSGRDVLVPAREVRMWLEWRTDALVMFHPGLAHAAICLDLAWQRQVGGRGRQLGWQGAFLAGRWRWGCCCLHLAVEMAGR
jgi:hypothetical protein